MYIFTKLLYYFLFIQIITKAYFNDYYNKLNLTEKKIIKSYTLNYPNEFQIINLIVNH